MKAIYKNFEINAEYKGDKVWKADARYTNSNNHIVTVTNLNTNESCDFEFWTSIARPQMTKESDVIEAFGCFLDDAIAAMDVADEWDFFDNLGYTPSRETKEIYEECRKSAEKARRVIGDDDTIYDLANGMIGEYR